MKESHPLFRLLILSIFVISAGCSQHHTVDLDPALPVSRSDLGKNKSVTLKVIDSRPSQVISRWKGGFNFRSFSISAKQDAREILYEKIEQGLQISGFTPKQRSSVSGPALTVEILRLKSTYDEKGPNFGIKVDAALRTQCRNNDSVHRMVYQEHLARHPIPPASFPNETLVNAALSGALQKMFADQKLMACLAN